MDSSRKAFTMLELTFVIVIIGILSAIAVPKFAVTRNDALISKGKTTLAAVRNAIATEKQRRILRGDFTAITELSYGSVLFGGFNKDKNGAGVSRAVLEYPPSSCSNAGCWSGSGTSYVFKLPTSSGVTDCTYTLASNKLKTASSACKQALED